MLYLKSFLYARDATMSLSNRASPVELIAELVQVVLEIARRDVMVDIQQKPFGVADGDMDPWKDLADLCRFYDLMDVLLHKRLEVHI